MGKATIKILFMMTLVYSAALYSQIKNPCYSVNNLNEKQQRVFTKAIVPPALGATAGFACGLLLGSGGFTNKLKTGLIVSGIGFIVTVGATLLAENQICIIPNGSEEKINVHLLFSKRE